MWVCKTSLTGDETTISWCRGRLKSNSNLSVSESHGDERRNEVDMRSSVRRSCRQAWARTVTRHGNLLVLECGRAPFRQPYAASNTRNSRKKIWQGRTLRMTVLIGLDFVDERGINGWLGEASREPELFAESELYYYLLLISECQLFPKEGLVNINGGIAFSLLVATYIHKRTN